MQSYHAFRIHEQRAGVETLTLDQPVAGEVLIRVHWSGINYKDALAGTGKGRIVRRFPLVGGVDLAGVVVSLERRRRIRPATRCWSRAADCRKRATVAMPSTRACRPRRW